MQTKRKRKTKTKKTPIYIYRIFGIFALTLWILFPFIWGHYINNFNVKWYLYEVFWYVSMLSMIFISYYMKAKIKEVIPCFKVRAKDIPCICKVVIVFIYIVLVIVVIIDCFYSLSGSKTSYTGLYGSKFYDIYLNILRIFIFLPSILIIFINFFVFLFDYINKAFTKCKSIKDLIENSKYIKLYKSINSLLFWGYVIFFGCTFMAYSVKPYIFDGEEYYVSTLVGLFSKDSVKIEADFAYVVHFLYMLSPIIVAFPFYYYTSRKLKAIVMSGIANVLKDDLKEFDLDKIRLIYFNDDSPYIIKNKTYAYLSMVIAPAIFTTFSEKIVEMLLQ